MYIFAHYVLSSFALLRVLLISCKTSVLCGVSVLSACVKSLEAGVDGS